MKALAMHLKMLGLSIAITFIGILLFIAFALIAAEATGQYHCQNEGGNLIGGACAIEVSND